MRTPMTAREEAEAIEQFGDDLAKLMRAFDLSCRRMSAHAIDRVNAIPNQDELDTVAEAFRALGDQLCREDDQANVADDERRDGRLQTDYRRLGQ